MPYEKSDNTTNVVRPTLTKIQQKKKDTPQYRKYIKDKIEKEQLQRMSQDPHQAQIGQGRNYSAAEQKHREDKSKQMLEAEQQAKANQEAEVIIGGLTAPLLLNRIVGAAFHPDTHNLIDAIANLYTTDNHGFTEISDKTRQWAVENPEENAMINLVGDIVGPGVLTRGVKLLPKVGFQQGGLRVGNYVYRVPRTQLNVGIPIPERIQVKPTAEELAARKFFPIEQYGDAPIYSVETMPKEFKIRRPVIEESPTIDEDITYLDFNFDHSTPMSSREAVRKAQSLFDKSPHGRLFVQNTYNDLSTDSYDWTIHQLGKWAKEGKGHFYFPESAGKQPTITLNHSGKRPYTRETVDLLNQKIARLNQKYNLNVPQAEWVEVPPVNPKFGKTIYQIRVSPLGFFKFKNGGLINCIPDHLLI